MNNRKNKAQAAEMPSAAPPHVCGFAAQTIQARMERMLSESGGVRSGSKPEAIHQMRVWSRRTRAALDIFAPCFSGKEYAALVEEIKAVTAALGTARDLDVIITTMQERANSLPANERGGVLALAAELTRQRKKVQPAVKRTVERLEKRDVAERFIALAARCGSGKCLPHGHADKKGQVTVDPNAPLLTNAAKTIRRRLTALCDYEPCLREPTRVRQHHAMRIAAKRLRYTMDIFQAVVTGAMPDAAPYLAAFEAVRTMQDHLGTLHDCDVLVPQLTARLTKITRDGWGINKAGEPVVGVDCIDWDACDGIIRLCRETVALREKQFAALQADWETWKTAGLFDGLRSALNQVSKFPITPAPHDERAAADSEGNILLLPALPNLYVKEGKTEDEETPAETGTRRRAASPAARTRAASSRNGNAAHTRRHSGSGADTPAGLAEGRDDEPA